MEGLTRLVSESLVRHGLDRPIDYRRLRWSRWFRCESHHSLLQVPSKPGVFALAEEIIDFGSEKTQVGTVGPSCPAEQFSAALAPEGTKVESAPARRMLAVTQFFEDDDMAFVLDRMLTPHNPMRARLASGRYFVRFVVIEDHIQRRSICNALQQWLTNSADKASGIGTHFAASLDLTPAHSAGRLEVGQSLSANAGTKVSVAQGDESAEKPVSSAATSLVDSGAVANRHCPPPFPSGF